MLLSITIVHIVLNFINIFLHGTGIYLLNILRKREESNIQNLLILNLSVTELSMNAFELIRTVFLLLKKYNLASFTTMQIEEYLSIVMYFGISIVFYLDMSFITLDRLLNILLAIRYRIYCTEERAKYLLYVTWTIGGILSITISVVYHYFGIYWEEVLYKFVYPILGFAFLLLAIVTYIYIFKAYNKSESVASQRQKKIDEKKTPDSSFKIFRKSRFFVAVFLIFSFILFMVVPDLVILFVGVVNGDISDLLMSACWVSYAICNMADACVYIFLQNRVRRLLWRRKRQVCTAHHIFDENRTKCEHMRRQRDDVKLSYIQTTHIE